MAPELTRGLQPTSCSGPLVDVYSLGAILYELLTGRPPFVGETILDTLEQARTQEPVPPRRLQPKVPPDLETICLKCLEMEPQRRYPSALDLADDLRRFLDGSPIQARPASSWMRLAKWVRRKPAAAALAAVSALSLLILIGSGLMYQARLRAGVVRAENGEAAALRQQQVAADRYRAARDTLNQMLTRVEGKRLADVPRLKELRQELLEDSLAFYQEILKEAGDPDPAVRLDTAHLFERTGEIQYVLNRPGPAEESMRRCIDLVTDLPAEYQQLPETQALLAEGYSYLGQLIENPREIVSYQEKRLAIYERLASEHPQEVRWQMMLSSSLHNLGGMYQAEHYYDRAIGLYSQMVRDYPQMVDIRVKLAESNLMLGLLYFRTQQHAKAVAAYQKADAILGPLVREHADVPEYALSLAGLYINWGCLLAQGKGQVQAMQERYRQAAQLADAVLQQEPRHLIARERSSEAHGGLAQAYEKSGRWAGAVKEWDLVVKLADGESYQVKCQVNRAVALVRSGDHDRATAEASSLTRGRCTQDDRYNLACVYSLAMGAARADGRLPTAGRTALADQYGIQAMRLLKPLQKEGYFQGPAHGKLLQEDSDFDCLRSRGDFQELQRGAAEGKNAKNSGQVQG
jgi:tetratricopeptide (TPR) repeat protein